MRKHEQLIGEMMDKSGNYFVFERLYDTYYVHTLIEECTTCICQASSMVEVLAEFLEYVKSNGIELADYME